MTTPGPASRGALAPVELAHAAVMGALAAATAIIAVVVPFAAALSIVGTIPTGVLAYRARARVLVTSGVVGGIIAFLIAGTGGMMTVANCVLIGALVGIVRRRGRGLPTVLVAAAAVGALIGVAGVVALTVLVRLRTLIADSLTALVDGATAVLERLPLPGGTDAANVLQRTFAFGAAHWELLLVGYGVLAIGAVSLFAWWGLRLVVRRLEGVPDSHQLDVVPDDAAPGPVPVTLREVGFRYPDADRDALAGVSLHVCPGDHVAVTGANGSGKTTVMRLLAGRPPTSGTVERPGSVALGKLGGTALVLQHPEAQVLGTRVADDVVWGLPREHEVDVEALLAEVGLDGLAGRDTGGLSGGELQRLAVAAALARHPSLLVADEVTTMVDQQGRETLLAVLDGLTAHRDMALVHITHYEEEARSADRVVHLAGTARAQGTDLVGTAEVHRAPPVAPREVGAAPLLVVERVGHVYAAGTPWASRALHDVSFTVAEGEGVLIHGGNGSGKSTLAWILAGLTVPTTGECLLDGRPTADQVGTVAMSFQAARLQLMRGTVGREVAASAGFDPQDRGRVLEALGAVGLGAAHADRRIDELSGGQLRRVVLAGLIAGSPRALLLDEPLAGLDADSQRGLIALLTDLRRSAGLTVMVISHDFAGLEELCPRTLRLREGTLEPTAAAEGMA